jgi:hypothetical protein
VPHAVCLSLQGLRRIKFLTTLNTEEFESPNRFKMGREIESVFETLLKSKSMARWLHWRIIAKLRVNPNPSQTLPANSKWRNTSRLILCV